MKKWIASLLVLAMLVVAPTSSAFAGGGDGEDEPRPLSTETNV